MSSEDVQTEISYVNEEVVMPDGRVALRIRPIIVHRLPVYEIDDQAPPRGVWEINYTDSDNSYYQ
jgi:hypothetical protein